MPLQALVIFGVWFLDYVLKIDDPVGAVAVHGFNGVWGTLAVGLFATGKGQDGITGLFYGGGFTQLGIQALGVLTVGAWTAVTVTILFFIIKKTIGLRASREEEMVGLDLTEHGLVSSYADFMPAVVSNAALDDYAAPEVQVPVAQAVPVQVVQGASKPASDVEISKVDIILKQSKLEDLKSAMDEIGITGMTVTQVLGCGVQRVRPSITVVFL